MLAAILPAADHDQRNNARAEELRRQVSQNEIEAAQPAEDDPAQLDELPYAAAAFNDAPEDIKARIYAASGLAGSGPRVSR
jgi:hypothetical protein